VAGVISAALHLYRQQLGPALTTVALVVIPTQILAWLIVRISLNHPFAFNGTVYVHGSTAVPALAAGALGFVSAILVGGALSRLFVDTYTGHPTSWQESIAYAAGHLGSLVVLAVVAGVALAIGFVLLFIPGIFLTVAWCVAVPALVFEGTGPVRALNRSWQLVKGYWFATFAVLLLAVVIVIGVSFLLNAIIGGIESFGSVNAVLALAATARGLAAIVTYPIASAVIVVIYANLRRQKEGVAPHQLIEGPAGAPAAPPATSAAPSAVTPPAPKADT
jgi:hypothetical protein